MAVHNCECAGVACTHMKGDLWRVKPSVCAERCVLCVIFYNVIWRNTWGCWSNYSTAVHVTQPLRGNGALLTQHVLGMGHLLQCLAVGKRWPVSRGGLFRGGCLLLAVCEGEGRRLVVTSVRGGRAVQKICFEIWRGKKRFSSASHSTLHDNTISKVTFRNLFTPKEIREAVLNNNKAASCARASFSRFCTKATACGKLSEAAARGVEIMHYDPKIDFFLKGKKTEQPSTLNAPAALWRCVHMCRSMCLAEGEHVAASLHTVDSPHCVKRKP